MARKFPTFIYSNPQNTKSKGPFIVHTLYPQFVCRLVDDPWTLELLEVFVKLENDADQAKVSRAMHDMTEWINNENFTT